MTALRVFSAGADVQLGIQLIEQFARRLPVVAFGAEEVRLSIEIAVTR